MKFCTGDIQICQEHLSLLKVVKKISGILHEGLK